ncbi:MAG: DUF3142 domain-containing protein [Dongiaceae bacterium]
MPLLLTGAARPGARPLAHDAYVWQRQWTPALRTALAEAGPLVRQWRVLAAESDGGRLQPVALDAAALAGHPATLVVRIDGRLADLDDDALIDGIAGLLTRWRNAGLSPAALEIDHDCGSAALASYAAFIERLRRRLPAMPLAITALPAWPATAARDRLFAQADEIVLQVHAVADPRRGLFDPVQARRWIDALARTGRLFRVALPTYGSRVAWRADGRLLAVVSERPLLAGGAEARELIAAPAAVAGLLEDLASDPPAGLRGIAWFRLPTVEDRRSWSLATWRAVIGGALPASPLTLAAETDAAGLTQLALVNASPVDAELPARIDLPPGCAEADGVNGYALQREGTRPVLLRQQPGLLPGRRRQPVGWMRCTIPEGSS